jgi:plasmid stabilization system protein ParE
LSPEAQAEFDEAVDWYEHQAGLGLDFVDRVRSVLNQIASLPEMYPVISGDVRRALIRRTPYAVYYRITPGRIDVIAVYHGSRDPYGWRTRA